MTSECVNEILNWCAMVRVHSESTARDMYLCPFGRVAGVSYLAIACILVLRSGPTCDGGIYITESRLPCVLFHVVEPFEPSDEVSKDLRQLVFGVE